MVKKDVPAENQVFTNITWFHYHYIWEKRQYTYFSIQPESNPMLLIKKGNTLTPCCNAFSACLQYISHGWGDYDSYFEKFSGLFEEWLVNCIMGNRTVRNCWVKKSKWYNYHKILSVKLIFRICHFYIQAFRKRCLTNFKSKRRLQENTISLLFELVYCAFVLE